MIWSMSNSCGFLGGSCGSDSAGGSNESLITGSRVASDVVEKASVSFGSVQICKNESQLRPHTPTNHPHLYYTLRTDKHEPVRLVPCVHSALQRRRRSLSRGVYIKERLEQAACVREEVACKVLGCLRAFVSVDCVDNSGNSVTFSPIGDMSLRRIFPFSISPMNSPIVSSSRMMRMKGSQMLQDLILGLAVFPSRSLMLCRSVPSNGRVRDDSSLTKHCTHLAQAP